MNTPNLPGLELESVLGRGGMGIVYCAREARLNRLVAVKVINAELADDPVFRRRFEGESRIAAGLEHPNVLPVYAANEHEGTLYLVTRYIEGSDLKEQLATGGRMAPARALAILGQVAQALDAAHAQGLVHRDVKPANILLAHPGTPSEHAYLTDFGLSKQVASVSGLTRTGQFVGTVDYIAPEQARGEGIDARADVYALGCVLYEMVTGHVPYPRDSDVAKLYAHLHDMPPPASTQAPGIPPALDAVIERALAKDPNTRYPSAGDLARAAHSALSGHAIAHPERSVARGAAATRLEDPQTTLRQPPRSPVPPPPRSPSPGPERDGGLRPRTLIALVVAALVLAGGGVAAALALSGGGDQGTKTTASGPRTITRTETSTSRPTTTTTSTTAPSPTTATSGGPPINATACSSGLSVGPQTSCAFAENVRRAYYKSGGGSGIIEAHSPTTGRDYELQCSEGATTVCITTDTGAKVYIS